MAKTMPKSEIMEEQSTNVLIVGVGGQGVIAASEIICDAAIRAGLDAKKSEVHGMSQRGGVVTSHVRVGQHISSPLISEGEADVILAFELAEGLRWVHFLKPAGAIIVNTQKIVPPIAYTLKLTYPDETGFENLSDGQIRLIKVNALDWAQGLGDPRLINTLLTGILSALPEMKVISNKYWLGAIQERFAKKMMEENTNAFKEGQKYQSGSSK